MDSLKPSLTLRSKREGEKITSTRIYYSILLPRRVDVSHGGSAPTEAIDKLPTPAV